MKKPALGRLGCVGCHLVGGGAGGTEPGLGSDELREELRMLVEAAWDLSVTEKNQIPMKASPMGRAPGIRGKMAWA